MICPGIWLLEFFCLRKVFLVLRLKDRKQSECCFFITLSELVIGIPVHLLSLDASLIVFVDFISCVTLLLRFSCKLSM